MRSDHERKNAAKNIRKYTEYVFLNAVDRGIIYDIGPIFDERIEFVYYLVYLSEWAPASLRIVDLGRVVAATRRAGAAAWAIRTSLGARRARLLDVQAGTAPLGARARRCAALRDMTARGEGKVAGEATEVVAREGSYITDNPHLLRGALPGRWAPVGQHE